MGCNSSSQSANAAPKGEKKSGDKKGDVAATPSAGSPGKLLDKYTLGKVLGQGAFGVVYKCKKKGTEEEFAVKMIDQVETPLVDIKREADMLLKLKHPTVIQLHDVFYEKVFVCMVLEFYRGGDMIQGMMAHWKTKGMIPISNVKSLSKQMHAACAWIHSQSCVHRDVKGDNFMMDKPNVENPQQKLFLSDFGTVREIQPGERISQKCGTKNYWPPEFFKMSYGMKVDCWAVGVVMFGLVSGKFPFKGEDDVKHKKLQIPKRCPDDGQKLIHALLEREEGKRMDCATALKQAFLQEGGATDGAQGEVFAVPTDCGADIKESGANAGVAQRRAELVDRLQNAEDGRKKKTVEKGQQKTYSVVDRDTERAMVFEWQPVSKIQDMVASFANAKPVPTDDMINREVTEESVRQQLLDHNVKIDGFGKGPAKKFSEFVTEVQHGSCRLMLDATKHKFVVRAVDVVLLRISHGSGADQRVLIETTPDFGSPSMPGSFQQPHENPLQTAERLRKQMLGMSDGVIDWMPSQIEAFEQVENSKEYPGIQTVYRKEIMVGQVSSTDPAVLSKLGIGGDNTMSFAQGKLKRTFEWIPAADCAKRRIRISAKSDKDGQDFSALVYPPIGLEEEELNEFLSKNHVDTNKWGKGTCKTIQDFSEELVKGEATLIRQPNGKIARVVDIVVLNLTRKDTGDVLVEAREEYKESVQHLNRLPAVKRRSDEHQFLTARRMVQKYLNLDINCVVIDHQDVKLIEEEQDSKSYVGLSTIYRKRYMKGVLLPAIDQPSS